jgi:hypothetical protein
MDMLSANRWFTTRRFQTYAGLESSTNAVACGLVPGVRLLGRE